MSIASEISRLQSDSTAIANAIAAKGVTVPSGSGFDDYATLIASISGGGGADFDDWVKDGDTHLWIDVSADDLKDVTIRIRMIGTIDWGDGTAKDTANVTTYTTFSHTYSDIGKYRIDLHPTSGTFYLGGNSTNYNVMGSRTNARSRKNSILYQAEVGTARITTISNYAFYYLEGLQRVYIPKNIVTLGTSSMSYCYSLTFVEFEDNMKIATLNGSVFFGSYPLNSDISFPCATNTAESAVARACHCLNSYTIGASVTSVAANSFNACFSLGELMCLPTTAPTIANTNAFTNLRSDCAIKVPIGSLSSYQSASIWSDRSAYMVEAGAIKFTLTNVSLSNKRPMTDKNGSYTTTLIPDTGKTLGTPTIKMGGTDITSTAYSAGVVTIANVTGNIEITASAS